MSGVAEEEELPEVLSDQLEVAVVLAGLGIQSAKMPVNE